METTAQETPPVLELGEEEREAIGAMVRRFVEGESFASIFGVSEGYIEQAQSQAYQLYRSGRYEDARTLCLGIISLDPDRYYPYLLIGDVELRQQGLTMARQYLEQAYERAPEVPAVVGKLGEVLLRAGEVEQGCHYLEQVLGLTDDVDDPYRRRAQTLLKLAEEA